MSDYSNFAARISDLSRSVASLTDEIRDLRTELLRAIGQVMQEVQTHAAQSAAEHRQLSNDHHHLFAEHGKRKTEHDGLFTEHGKRKTEHDGLFTEHGKRKTEHVELQRNHSMINLQVEDTRTLAEERASDMILTQRSLVGVLDDAMLRLHEIFENSASLSAEIDELRSMAHELVESKERTHQEVVR